MCVGAGDHSAAVKVWAEVRDLFPLQIVDQVARDSKKRKHYWSDFDVVSGEAGASLSSTSTSAGAAGGARVKLEEGPAPSAVPAVLSEGSVSPTDDLDSIVAALLAARDAGAPNVAELQACVRASLRVLERTIELLVLTGATSAHFRKALHCLQKLREVCLLQALREGERGEGAEVARFNQYLRERVKQQFKGGRHEVFWRSVVAAGVTLVQRGEAGCSSEVSGAEAAAFLRADEVRAAAVKEEAPPPQQEEEEDLFGDMA